MYLRSLQLARAGMLRAPEGGPTGDPTPAVVPVAPTPAPARASVPEVYSAEFIRSVMAERDALKSAASATEKVASEARAAADKAADEARAASEKAVKEAEGAVTKAAKAFSDRLIRAEVRTTATAAGLAHMDFLKLVDTSAVTVSDDGEVTIPKGFWEKVKADLPHLFQATGADRGTTSQTKGTPKPAEANRRKAADMSDADYKAALARIARGIVD